MRRFVFIFAAVVNLLLVDQMVKAAAVGYLHSTNSDIVVSSFFNLAYVENRGCAWGMFQGQVWPLAAFAVVMMAVLIWKRRSIFPGGKLGFVAEVLLYAGILGNLLDRVVRGFVVDMFDFHWGVHHFPVFNVADSYITVAVVFLLISTWLLECDKKGRAQNGA